MSTRTARVVAGFISLISLFSLITLVQPHSIVVARQAAGRSVWDGVYTEAQARRGAPLYKEKCGNCHGDQLTGLDAPPLVGAGFAANYDKTDLSVLFTTVKASMPADDPDTLSRAQVADIIAVILQAAEMPAGTAEVPSADAALKGIMYLGSRPAGATPTQPQPPTGTPPPQAGRGAAPPEATRISSASCMLVEGARLIIGDATAAIERGAFAILNGRIVSVGRQGEIQAPRGDGGMCLVLNLNGKTVMPTMVNAHVHIGYEGYTSWGAQNYTPPNVLDHLQREAFYGVGVTTSVGSSPTESSLQLLQAQEAGRLAPASRFFFIPGMAPPNGGPDAILMRGTSVLRAVNEVSTAAEARAAVQAMAAKNIKHVKMWVDDRRGTYPKFTPEVYNAIIDEAHKHQMIVHAHAIALADQKAVVRAGADVLVHMVQSEPLDEEYLAILREKKPYWTTVLGFGERSEVCNNDPFIDQMYPAAVLETIRAASCRPVAANANAGAREVMVAGNFQKMIANGARLVLGTDAGIASRHSFGWADHHELARWVELGLTPAQAIVAATSRPAELLGIRDMGTLAVGKSADFVVLDANPIENIRNTRTISAVYLRGALLDRPALTAKWRGTGAR